VRTDVGHEKTLTERRESHRSEGPGPLWGGGGNGRKSNKAGPSHCEAELGLQVAKAQSSNDHEVKLLKWGTVKSVKEMAKQPHK